MSLKEDWAKLPTYGKVLTVGGLGLGVYVLFVGIRGANASSAVSTAANTVSSGVAPTSSSSGSGSGSMSMVQIAQQAASAQATVDNGTFATAYAQQQAAFAQDLQLQEQGQQAFLTGLIQAGSAGDNVTQHAHVVNAPTTGGYKQAPTATLLRANVSSTPTTGGGRATSGSSTKIRVYNRDRQVP